MKCRICLAILLLAPLGSMAATPAPAGAAAGATGQAAAGVAALVAEAGRIGNQARLPPHLVEVLGLGTHVGGLAVRQLALRQGSVVRTFNVSAANALDIVIFDYDEATRATLVCLLTPAAKLRRAVTYVAGDAPHVLAMPEARRRFGPELNYWLAIRLSASPASR
ncbi:MAG TPA: hypothetical protein VKC11_12670 [Steroidobacteraceae bacterium]|nr:hypothetical protein [Steroidobacteraceae bacterium]